MYTYFPSSLRYLDFLNVPACFYFDPFLPQKVLSRLYVLNINWIVKIYIDLIL